MTKILIIDDDSLIADIYRDHLEREGFMVEVATDGQAGFYRVHELRPDAVLLDLMLPHISGLEILQKIRAQAQFQKLPVVVFSNSYQPSLFQKAKEAGATKLFNKAGAKPREIVEAVKAACTPDLTGIISNAAAPAPTPSDKPASMVMAKPQEGLRMAEARQTVQPGDLLPRSFSSEADAASRFQSEMRGKFLKDVPERLGTLRKQFRDVTKADAPAAVLPKLMELHRGVHVLTGQAGVLGYNETAQVCSALEALVKELHDKPKYINSSTLRTIAQSLDLLDTLVKTMPGSEKEVSPFPLVLVVDDDAICRQTVCSALKKANLTFISVDSPELALKLGAENNFNLVLSDVEMPGMNGFEMCTKWRAASAGSNTPFVFVTSLSDFESRARSTLSGGQDLIGKPFLLVELAVKALIHILKNQA